MVCAYDISFEDSSGGGSWMYHSCASLKNGTVSILAGPCLSGLLLGVCVESVCPEDFDWG